MNRKLQRSTLALSATSAVLAMLLLAGGPVPLPPQAAAPAQQVALDATSDTAGIGSGADADAVRQSQRRHVRRSRAALALPYFSFAQGLRRITGG